MLNMSSRQVRLPHLSATDLFCRQHSADRVRRNDHMVGARRQCRAWERDIGTGDLPDALNQDRIGSARSHFCRCGLDPGFVANTTNHPGVPNQKGTNRECTCGRLGCITGVRVAAIKLNV